MNAHLHEDVASIIAQAGAVASCGDCQSYDVYQFDEDADRHAYALATKAWKEDEFPRSTLEEVREAVKSALGDANMSCPGCRESFA